MRLFLFLYLLFYTFFSSGFGYILVYFAIMCIHSTLKDFSIIGRNIG